MAAIVESIEILNKSNLSHEELEQCQNLHDDKIMEEDC